MENPSNPVLVDSKDAECFQNQQDSVDLEAIPILIIGRKTEEDILLPAS